MINPSSLYGFEHTDFPLYHFAALHCLITINYCQTLMFSEISKLENDTR